MNYAGNRIWSQWNVVADWWGIILLQKFPDNNWYYRFYKERMGKVYWFIGSSNWDLDCLITDTNLKRLKYLKMQYNRAVYRFWVKADEQYIYVRSASNSDVCYKYTYDFINTWQTENISRSAQQSAQWEYNWMQIFTLSTQHNQVGIYLVDKRAWTSSDAVSQNI